MLEVRCNARNLCSPLPSIMVPSWFLISHRCIEQFTLSCINASVSCTDASSIGQRFSSFSSCIVSCEVHGLLGHCFHYMLNGRGSCWLICGDRAWAAVRSVPFQPSTRSALHTNCHFNHPSLKGKDVALLCLLPIVAERFVVTHPLGVAGDQAGR